MAINGDGRKIDYLRISVTDRCNLRCIYCMPEAGIESVPHKEILTFEEITRLVSIFAKLGTRIVRLTGGEPLARAGVAGLCRSIADIPGIENVALTTNGVLLCDYAAALKKAGVSRINISLDTIREDKFRAITRKSCFHQVKNGIDEAIRAGFERLKINTVVMKGINDDEIIDFVEYAISKKVILRFIEFMRITPLWREDLFVSVEEIKNICEDRFDLERMENPGPGPAEHYKVNGMPILGFIKTDRNNCRRCSRLRLTSAGDLKICLYETPGLSLKGYLRGGASDREIMDIIKERIFEKQFADYSQWEPQQVYMSGVGG